MTLNTNIYFTAPIEPHEVYEKVSELLGIDHTQAKYDVKEDGSIMNKPGQGFPAWVSVHYQNGEPVPPLTWEEYSAHMEFDDSEEEDERGYYDRHQATTPTWYVRVNLDTAYGYRYKGGGCNNLHAQVILQLDAWLEERGQGGSLYWKNEYEGTVDNARNRTAMEKFCGEAAMGWFRDLGITGNLVSNGGV